MLAPGFNPVPLGHANTGDAVVLGDGLGGLRYMQRTDALEEARRQRAALAAQKQQADEFKDFSTRLNLADDTGVHFLPQLQASAQNAHTQMLAVAANKTLTREQKAAEYQRLADEQARLAKAGTRVDQSLLELGNKVTGDKRYDRDKTFERIYGTLYERNEDGTPKLGDDGQQVRVSPVTYDPRQATDAVGTGYDHLNVPEIYKTFLRGTHPDAVTSSRQPLPGGRGYRNVASSDVYELTDDGKIKYDPATNLPVVKATPQTLNYFLGDPVNRQYFEAVEQQHQQRVASATTKLESKQELTPEEQRAVDDEQSPEGRQMALLKRGLLEAGYGRQSTNILTKAAPRPRAGRSTAPKFTQTGGTAFVPGVLGGTGAGGTRGVAHFGATDPLRRELASGDVKPYTANVTHRSYLMSTDGGPMQRVENNASPQKLEYQAPVVLLARPNGNIAFPGDPAIIRAAEQGDTAPLEAWARAERAKDPRLKPAYYMSAVPADRADLNVGSADEVFTDLKAKEDTYRQAYQQGATAVAQLAKDDPEAAKTARLAAMFGGGGKPPRFYTDAELREQARKLYANRNATLYVPYTGAEKLTIDANTGYSLRRPAQAKSMQQYLSGVESRTRPTPTNQRQALAGRGPLAGRVSPAAPAAPPKAAPAAPPKGNKFGFKFK